MIKGERVIGNDKSLDHLYPNVQQKGYQACMGSINT